MSVPPPFRNQIGFDIFSAKYAERDHGKLTWAELAHVLVVDVVGNRVPLDIRDEIERAICQMKFVPGGRYLRNAGRELKYFSNCFALAALEDSREDWADLSWKAESCLISGGGIGVDYSVYRPKLSFLKRTGGVASGPVSKMRMTNEQGREVMQGGSRRSAIYGSLLWKHQDAYELLHAKDWDQMKVPGTTLSIGDLKRADFNWPAPLDHTNISLNYDDEWLNLPSRAEHPVFVENVQQALRTAEPGMSFNFGSQSRFTYRNACTEFITDQDSDCCNLGSVVMSNCDSLEEFNHICWLGAIFLYCGTCSGLVPYDKVRKVRDENRRIGLGLMGMHEWLLQRGSRYEVTPELHEWLNGYRRESVLGANFVADRLGLPRPKAYRSIAPTGTIGMIVGTTTGIEPVFAVALKRRYLRNGHWRFQYVIDAMAKQLIEKGIAPTAIESAVDLANDVERRVKFQADVQDYVDMGISSTINLPAWGTPGNHFGRIPEIAAIVSKYAERLRGITFYPDGARGGQPLTAVPYEEALHAEGVEYEEHDSCKGGVCGT
jgi:ribonucleoside-diphosphate reductase alpha chain